MVFKIKVSCVENILKWKLYISGLQKYTISGGTKDTHKAPEKNDNLIIFYYDNTNYLLKIKNDLSFL